MDEARSAVIGGDPDLEATIAHPTIGCAVGRRRRLRWVDHVLVATAGQHRDDQKYPHDPHRVSMT
jgi:hypothetical protein